MEFFVIKNLDLEPDFRSTKSIDPDSINPDQCCLKAESTGTGNPVNKKKTNSRLLNIGG
jgi:hypothetical protein